MTSIGTLYGVSTGPGDADLVTRKAWRVISTAPVIAYPIATNGDSFARSIVADCIRGDAIEVPLRLPIGCGDKARDAVYDEVCATLRQHLQQGRDVAVLCEGDALFYGSFIPIATRLADQVACQIIPGIPAPVAAASIIGTPLAKQTDRFMVVSAMLDDEALTQAIQQADSIAIIKLGRHAGRIKQLLTRLNLGRRAQYIAYASLPAQHICPVADMPTDAPYFSLILIGAN